MHSGRRSQRSANVSYYRRNRQLELERVRVRQFGTVEMLRELKRVPCVDCGGTFEPFQMDFDHRNPKLKAFTLMSGGAMLRSTRSLLEEVAKCDIVCANCHRVRTVRQDAEIRREKRHTGTSARLEYKRRRWREQARLLRDLKRVPCADCGVRFSPFAMEFDHRDPASKRASVTRMVGRAGTQRILDEAGKCDIVCCNCHRARTFARRSSPLGRE